MRPSAGLPGTRDADQAFLEPAARQPRPHAHPGTNGRDRQDTPWRMRNEHLRALPDASGCCCASCVGIALGQLLPGLFQLIGDLSIAQVNLPVGLLIWVMIIPMLVKVDFGALGQIRRHVQRHRRHAVRQLAGQALLDGASRLDFHPPRVCAAAAGRPARQLHRRPDPAGRGALHGDGVRLEPPDRRRSALHALAGGPERHHHGGGLRARWWGCCWESPRSPCPGARW